MATRSITRSCSQFAAASNSCGAARAFLQLAPRRHHHTSPLLPVLDFLVPSVCRTLGEHGWISRSAHLAGQRVVTRSFTSSAVRKQTTAVVNPKTDEDGIEISVEITPRASNRLKEIMVKDSNPNLALRIQVESGGCHGFQYLMSLTTLPPLDSYLDTMQKGIRPASANSTPSSPFSQAEAKVRKLDEDDTVFAAEDGSGAKVVMDGPSLELLKGSKVDFTMELIGSQFKIVDNPLATSSCGCGTSFDIKA